VLGTEAHGPAGREGVLHHRQDLEERGAGLGARGVDGRKVGEHIRGELELLGADGEDDPVDGVPTQRSRPSWFVACLEEESRSAVG